MHNQDLERVGAAWDRGPRSGFRIRPNWSLLSSITSMSGVTAALPPSLSKNDGYKVLNTSWHHKRASYIMVPIIKSCPAVQALRPTCCVTLCRSLHFSKLGFQCI